MSFSRVQIFDRTHWQERWRAEIPDTCDPSKIAIVRLRRFMKAYHGPNPLDIMYGRSVIRKVKDSCLIPTVVPQTVTVDRNASPFSLLKLEELAKHPAEGPAAKYKNNQSSALQQHGHTPAGETVIVLQLDEVAERGKSWEEQLEFLDAMKTITKWDCETRPKALPQNTVVFAHHNVTDERPLGNGNGKERQPTGARTDDPVVYNNQSYPMFSGYFSKSDEISKIGGSAPAELFVSNFFSFVHEDGGVGVQRKF